MSPELRSDCDELLRHSMKITQAMIEIACMREWFATAQAMIDFRRCLVQALDIKSSQLLQVPHFTEETLEKIRKHKTEITTLSDFLALDAEERKEILGMEPEEFLDVQAFCQHVGEIELKASVEVEDESEIVVGDVATVTVRMMRKAMRENEATGPAHAPFFPDPKFEEWWFFLVAPSEKPGKDKPSKASSTEKTSAATRIVHFERVMDRERYVEEQLRFQVTNPGKNTLVLHAHCDAYAGIDKKVELTFHAHGEEEFKRQLPMHKDDEDLDLQPTLFQQWMGDLSHADESDEEEEEDRPSGGAPMRRRGGRPDERDKGHAEAKSPAGKSEALGSREAGGAEDKDSDDGSGESSSDSD